MKNKEIGARRGGSFISNDEWDVSKATVSSPHLLSPFRETRVASDPSFNVEVALSVPAQVYGAWRDVDVHEVIHDPALDVILDSVHKVPPTHIDDLYEGQLSKNK